MSKSNCCAVVGNNKKLIFKANAQNMYTVKHVCPSSWGRESKDLKLNFEN
jgi:hypothetical protein